MQTEIGIHKATNRAASVAAFLRPRHGAYFHTVRCTLSASYNCRQPPIASTGTKTGEKTVQNSVLAKKPGFLLGSGTSVDALCTGAGVPEGKKKPGFLAKTLFCSVFSPVLVRGILGAVCSGACGQVSLHTTLRMSRAPCKCLRFLGTWLGRSSVQR